MKTGNNIRQRKDGRFEARYIKDRTPEGKIVYGYCYGQTYDEAEYKRELISKQKNSFREINLLILGAGDHGTEVYEIAKSLRIFAKISFLDDHVPNVLGKVESLEKYLLEYPVAIAAVGDNSLRCKWMNELNIKGFIIPTLIHPSAVVSSDVEISAGSVIYAGATIGRNVKIGRGCIIDTGSVIERNTTIPDWSLVRYGEVLK